MFNKSKRGLLIALGCTTLLMACNDSEYDETKEYKVVKEDVATVTIADKDYTYPIGSNKRLIIKDNLGLSMEQAIQTAYVNDIVSNEEKTFYSTDTKDKSKYGRIENTELSTLPLVYYKADYLQSIDTELFILQVYDKSADYELTFNMERTEDTISVQNTIVKLALVDVPKINEQYGEEAYNFIKEELSNANEIEVVEELSDIFYLNQTVPLVDNDTSNYYVYVDGELLNAKIVEKGLGIVSKYILDEEKDRFYYAETKNIRESILKSEKIAKSDGKGVWSIDSYVSETGFPSSEIDSNIINK